MFFPSTENIDYSQQPPPLPPNKPPASKMAVDPTEDKINNLVDFCSGVGSPISRNDAIRYLKVKNNNVDAAFEAFFSNEDISQQEQAVTWDEGLWSQGKDGPGAGGGDGMNDPHLRPLLSSTAPTRNNSPSPAARSSLHPNSKQQEDEDFAQAMAASQGNDWFQQQESGVVTSGGQETQFGPANRGDYDPRQWAMVPTGASTSGEIVPDADVEERVGKAGEPRMLKQLPGSGEYLANLLTILANVYGAREAMLMRERTKEDYGQDGEWWKGHSISMPKIVALGDGPESGAEGEGDQYDDLLAETQRLMAFLSESERSYGSAGALTHTDAIKSSDTRSVRSNTTLELFMQTWGVAAVAKAGEESGLASLFTTTVGTNASEGMDDTDMTLIDMPVDATTDPNKPQELQELLDGLLWDTSDPHVSSDNYIERPAEVLVMRLRQRMNSNGNGQLKVVVPPEFYVDKYLREHIESTRATRAEMAKGKKKVEKIEQIERKLRVWRNPKDGKEIDASKLVSHTLKYYHEENEHHELHLEGQAPNLEITDKLDAVVSSIDAKLTALAAEKEKTLATIAAMSRAPPPGLEPDDQQHRYILRGVATKPHITYVLAHEPDDPPAGDAPTPDDDDNTYAGMRWWRLEYDTSATSGLAGARISKLRVPDYDVHRAVELEHDKALLVYGSMRVNAPPAPDEVLPLPAPLQRFVAQDNALFAAEREGERTRPPAYQSFDLAGGDADSGLGGDGDGKRASMDSTRVEGGSPPEYEDVGGFERHHSFGLPPDFQGAGGGYGGEGVEDAPVAEIRLDEGEGDEGVEMVERVHEPLVPRGGGGSQGGGGDVEMGEGK